MRYGKIQILSQTKSYCGCISWELAAEIPDIAKASEEELSEEMVCTPITNTRFTTKMGIFDFHTDREGVATILEYGELQKFPRVTE